MLFLDFLRLFFCIMLVNAHPISKSNSHISEFDSKMDTGDIVQLNSTDTLVEKIPHLNDEALEDKLKMNKLNLIRFNKNHDDCKRKLSTKEIDLSGFERLEKLGNKKKIHNSIKTYKFKDKESDLKQNTDSYQKIISSASETVTRFLNDKHVFYNGPSIESTRDDFEFAGTAEIEAILNEIKQRELEVIVEQMPTVSNLITNTVTETTFTSMPSIRDSSAYPDFAFSTYLFADNASLMNLKSSPTGNDFQDSEFHSMVLRSIKDDSSTLAQDVENVLQKKLKNVYRKIKDKLSKDLKKELSKTKTTAREQVDRINKKICNTTQRQQKVNMKNSTLPIATTIKVASIVTNCTRNEGRNNRNTLFNNGENKNEYTTSKTHTIPSIGDDLSMLSIVEQLLEKTQENYAFNMLTTPSYLAKKDKDKLFKRNSRNEHLKKNIRQLLNNEEDVFYTDYTYSNSGITNNTYFSESTETMNTETDSTTEDSSYEGLSNKLSYNDYVNGYKYYLNYQRDMEDQKYSNQIRYQAHKHHNVDDIGKFILNKIPHLPATRLRRDFVDSETLEDQDVSTKSEDSWFKKHFSIFIDSNPPKKFHTSQTVSLKPPEVQKLNNANSNNTTNHKIRSPLSMKRRVKKHINRLQQASKQTYLDGSKNVESRIVRKISRRSKQKPDTLSTFDYKKNGFVDIDFIEKPTAIIKLNNKNKKKHKIGNIFQKIRFGRKKPKKKEKRQSQNNRFNIFKGIKNIFKDKIEIKSTKTHKIFDYDVMAGHTNVEEPYKLTTLKKLLNINDLRQQIPNITVDTTPSQPKFDGGYNNLTDIAAANAEEPGGQFIYPVNPVNPVVNPSVVKPSYKPGLDHENENYSILTESQYLKPIKQHTKTSPNFSKSSQKDTRVDDIINVYIKTKIDNLLYTPELNTISYTPMSSMSRSNIQNEIEEMRTRLWNYDETKKIYQDPFNIRKELKNRNFNSLYAYPQKKILDDLQMELNELNDVIPNDGAFIETPTTIADFTSSLFFEKKNTRANNRNSVYNSYYPRATLSKLRRLKDKSIKSNIKNDIKKIERQKTTIFEPTVLAKDKSLNNLVVKDKKIDMKNNKYNQTPNELTMYKYGNISNESTTKRILSVSSSNYKTDASTKRPFTKVNTLPEQYYSTPLPMKTEDFYNFLKDQNMDIATVTAPLPDSLLQRIDTWNIYKNNFTKAVIEEQKLMGNNEYFKEFNKYKKYKPRLEKQKGIDKGKVNKNIQDYNKMINNQQRVRTLRRPSILIPYDNSESMDLFHLDDTTKKTSTKLNTNYSDLDVTVIDLDDDKVDSDSDIDKLLLNVNADSVNKFKQNGSKSNLLNKNESQSRTIHLNRDPLRFSHIYYTKSPQKTMKEQLYGYQNRKTTFSQTQPQRVQISGHSYKYDIIYQQPTNDWMRDLDIHDDQPSLYLQKSTTSGNPKNLRLMTATTKHKTRDSRRYYRKGNYAEYINKNFTPLDSLFRYSKQVKKNNLDQLSREYNSLTSNKAAGTSIKRKNKFFLSFREPKNINDEVYFEPLIRRKSKRKTPEKLSHQNNKFYKREVPVQDSFTAKDVAAFEVVVDLMKSTESLYDKGIRNDMEGQKINDGEKYIPYIVNSSKQDSAVTNAIQVHIALPSNINDRRRSLEGVKVRKVFSAVMSSPVDLEYKVHSFEDKKSTKAPQDIISPGLYLLVENTNITSPYCNFALKPIRTVRTDVGFTKKYNETYINDIKSSIKHDIISNITLNPNVVAAVSSPLAKLYENLANLNETKPKRYIKKEIILKNQKSKRNINMETFKKHFDHSRVCHCRCQVNKTMCKPCAASDAVMGELTFEFDNLAKFMSDHCTEIQTFFYLNPTGGRKLKDSVHRIDTALNDYYKRLKDKCQGRTCQMISSSIDKREYTTNSSMSQILNDVEVLDNYLKNVAHCFIFDANVFRSGKNFVSSVENCIDTGIISKHDKRSYLTYLVEPDNKNVYSLNNIKVNLICNKDLLPQENNGLTRNNVKEGLFETSSSSNIPMYYDEDEIKKERQEGSNIKKLLKKICNKFKLNQMKTEKAGVSNSKKLWKKISKRHSASDNLIDYKYLRDNTREIRDLNENNRSIACGNKKLTILKVGEKIKTTNATNSSKNEDVQETDSGIDSSSQIDTLNHNLNDLFKLLGYIETVGTKKEMSKLTTSSKQTTTLLKNPIYRENLTMSKLTIAEKLATTQGLKTKTTHTNHYLRSDLTKIQQHTKKEELKTTKKALMKTLTSKTIPSTNIFTIHSKSGLFNRIVGGSWKFLGSKVNKDKIFAKPNVDSRPENFENKSKKNIAKSEKNPLKQNDNYEVDSSYNLTSTDPKIIIIEDIGFFDKSTVPIKRNSGRELKSTSYKLLKKNNCGKSTQNQMNNMGLNSLSHRVKIQKP